MKRLLPILLLLSLSAVATAQKPETEPKYKDQYAALYREYTKNPNDVANLVDMAAYFANPGNPMHNLPQAMGYNTRANERYTELLKGSGRENYREMQRLMRRDVSLNAIRQQSRDIEVQALQYVRQHLDDMTPAERKSYLKAFSSNDTIVKLIRRREKVDAFGRVKEENTLAGYYAFREGHPGTAEADTCEQMLALLAPRYFALYDAEELVDAAAKPFPNSPSVRQAAMRQKSRLAYAAACKANTIEAYSAYLEHYPRGSYYVQALNQLQQQRVLEYSRLTTPDELADFADTYSDDPLADSAIARLRNMVLMDHSQAAARVYLDRFPLDDQHSNIYRHYYSWFADEGNRQPIQAFADKNPDYRFVHTLRMDLERGSRIDSFDLMKPYVERDFDTMTSVVRLLTGRKVSYVALQRILQQLIVRKDWNGAKRRMQYFEICFEDLCQKQYAELSTILSGSGPAMLTVLPADSIARVVPHPKGYVACNRIQHGRQVVSLAQADKKGYRYATNVTIAGCEVVPQVFNFYSHGAKVLLGINGDIWSADVLSDTLWQVTHRFPAPVNTSHVETDAFMLEDGSGMLLASDRPDGMNVNMSRSYYHGDTALATDLYFIPFDGSHWGDAVNLGSPVNSPYCERSPLLSRNLKTLYFITDARGLGYGDVYQVNRNDVGDWRHWSEPVNLGKTVNGAFDESTIAFGDNERKIFVTSTTSADKKSCSSFATQHDTASAYRTIVVDVSNLALTLYRMSLADTRKGMVQVSLAAADIDSLQSFSVLKGKEYAVLAYAYKQYVPTALVRPNSLGITSLIGYSYEQLVQEPRTFPLPLVHFRGETTLLQELAEDELWCVAHFLQQNTDSQVEIVVNVPGKDDRQCYELSLERGKALRTYLSEEYSIDPSRIHLSAYGNVQYKGKEPATEVLVRFY